MAKPETTVLLLKPDRGLAEDPYITFLRTVPEMLEVPVDSPAHRIVAAFRELARARFEMKPEQLDDLRRLLLNLDEGRDDVERLAARARAFAAAVFHGSPGTSYPQDLVTLHTEIALSTHGTPGAEETEAFHKAWGEWKADRARLREAGSILDPDLDVLMAQLWTENVDVEEAEEAVADLLERDVADAKAALRVTRVSELLPDGMP